MTIEYYPLGAVTGTVPPWRRSNWSSEQKKNVHLASIGFWDVGHGTPCGIPDHNPDDIMMNVIPPLTQ